MGTEWMMTQVNPRWGMREDPGPKGEQRVAENLRTSSLDSVPEKVSTKFEES